MENMEASTGVVQKAMSQRTCGSCRWWNKHSGLATGDCQKRSPNSITSKWPSTDEVDFCGEWADDSITHEQEERRELVRRFAVAIADGLARDAKMTAQETVEHIWRVAETLADAEPNDA